MHITTLGIDVAKSVFQLHGVDARGAQATRDAQSVVARGGKSAALCDRDGGVRECAALETGVRAARAYREADAPEVCPALCQDQQE